MIDRLNFYAAKNNKRLPERLIIFRDGVAEGMFQIILKDEYKAIRDACDSLQKGSYKPKITIIVCAKRHQTRFFPTEQNIGGDNNGTMHCLLFPLMLTVQRLQATRNLEPWSTLVSDI